MTLSQYTLMHRRARLSASDVLTLCSWTGQVAGAQEGEHFLETEDSTVYTRHQLRRMRERELAEMLGPEFRPQIADVVVEACSATDGMLSMVKGTSADLLVLGVRSGGSFTRAATHALGSIISNELTGLYQSLTAKNGGTGGIVAPFASGGRKSRAWVARHFNLPAIDLKATPVGKREQCAGAIWSDDRE
jgi:hypothetical protein